MFGFLLFLLWCFKVFEQLIVSFLSQTSWSTSDYVCDCAGTITSCPAFPRLLWFLLPSSESPFVCTRQFLFWARLNFSSTLLWVAWLGFQADSQKWRSLGNKLGWRGHVESPPVGIANLGGSYATMRIQSKLFLLVKELCLHCRKYTYIKPP